MRRRRPARRAKSVATAARSATAERGEEPNISRDIQSEDFSWLLIDPSVATEYWADQGGPVQGEETAETRIAAG